MEEKKPGRTRPEMGTPEYEEWRKEVLKRRRKRQLKERRKRLAIITVAMIVAVGASVGVGALKGRSEKALKEKTVSSDKQKEQTVSGEKASEAGTKNTETVSKDTLAEAELLASQYNYDKAIDLLKKAPSYDSDKKMQAAVKKYEDIKATCTAWPLEKVTHVFYHILIKDPSKAFDGDYKEADYNQVMTTIDEFNKITQIMYDKGYVMVSLHDMCNVDENGNVTRGTILLPEGKKAFVLSQDDVSYYHYQDGYGLADKLLIDENGDVKNQYTDAGGNVLIGDYDMVPWIDTFVKEHPDFSYHGHKGIIALTGYNGILGYRTDIAYKTRENLDSFQQAWFEQHPDFDEAAYNKECEDAKAVADAMKATGWEFASHTWGHINVGQKSLEGIQTDTEKWLNYVSPLVGGTDVIIFAFGADLGDWTGYTTDNEKFNYLKSQGFDIYCNVDSTQYWVQFGNDVTNGGQYMRQGRRNLDGYRMYYNPEMVEDLFDAKAVFDPARPTPVPPM